MVPSEKSINWLFEEHEVVNHEYQIYHNDKSFTISKEELSQLSDEERGKIKCITKNFIFDNKYQKWIVLFSDDRHCKYFYILTKEKSMENYQRDIYDEYDYEVVKYISGLNSNKIHPGIVFSS